jgi:hypothetical protein
MTKLLAIASRRPAKKNSLRLALLWALAVCTATARAQPMAASGEQRPPLDGLAAVLGGGDPLDPPRAVLRSDVELRARLSLLGHDSEHALFGALPASLLRATLDELLGEQLIAIEAERVQIAAPRASAVADELAVIEREAGGHRTIVRLLARLDASQLELEAMARRRALISAFLRANLEGVTVVTDREVEQRLAAEPERYAAETAPARAAAARADLAKEALARIIEQWVRVLRARTRVRVFAVFETR